MKRAGIAELKASLSEYLARVKSGEEILVTERGRPVARIVPVASHKADSGAIEELVRAGILRRPEKAWGKTFPGGTRAEDRPGAVLKALLKEREESR